MGGDFHRGNKIKQNKTKNRSPGYTLWTPGGFQTPTLRTMALNYDLFFLQAVVCFQVQKKKKANKHTKHVIHTIHTLGMQRGS